MTRLGDGRCWVASFAIVLAVALCVVTEAASAGSLRDRIAERRAARQQQQDQRSELDGEEAPQAAGALPPGVTLIRDVSYGSDPAQRFDVYRPAQADAAAAAPVIFMVHGGGWRRGDKSNSTVVENKRARWVPKGFIFISVNYRMLPQATPFSKPTTSPGHWRQRSAWQLPVAAILRVSS